MTHDHRDNPLPDPTGAQWNRDADAADARNDQDRDALADAIHDRLEALTNRALRLAEQKSALRLCLLNVEAFLQLQAMNGDEVAGRAVQEILRTLEETR